MNLDLLEQETVSGSGISRAICKSAPQTDNHASTPSLSFYRPDAFPDAQPTASKHWRHQQKNYGINFRHCCKSASAVWATETIRPDCTNSTFLVLAYPGRPGHSPGGRKMVVVVAASVVVVVVVVVTIFKGQKLQISDSAPNPLLPPGE